MAGMARPGEARHGNATQRRQGAAWHGEARPGPAWLGNAGTATNTHTHTKQMKPIFQLKNGASAIAGVKAQAIGEELDRIRVQQGTLTPQAIVDESTDEEAVPHPCFEWDNDVAANAFRKDQARHIARSVRVEYPDSTASEPAFVHISQGSDNYYETARTVVETVSLYDSAWRYARQQADAALKSLADLEQLAIQRQPTDPGKLAKLTAARDLIKQATDLLAVG